MFPWTLHLRGLHGLPLLRCWRRALWRLKGWPSPGGRKMWWCWAGAGKKDFCILGCTVLCFYPWRTLLGSHVPHILPSIKYPLFPKPGRNLWASSLAGHSSWHGQLSLSPETETFNGINFWILEQSGPLWKVGFLWKLGKRSETTGREEGGAPRKRNPVGSQEWPQFCCGPLLFH